MISRFSALLVAGLLFLAGPLDAAPRLSEFMADNKSVLADEDGDFSDWLEIFNPDPTPLDMSGYALTDDTLIPQKWLFPPVVIPSGGYLVVFASGKNRVNPDATLHTNFSLDAAGEYLALVAPDGTTRVTEFAPAFPLQEKDRSYGIALPTTTTTFLAQGSTCRWRVPSSEIAGWNGLGYSDSGWSSGVLGVGYERSPGDAINYTNLIGAGSNVNTAMYNINTSCYVRVPFNVADAAAVFALTLRMKFDDGFVAYINGVQVRSVNAPGSPFFADASLTTHADSEAVVFQNYDLSAFRSLLVTGSNVLAIHGLNSALNSSDLIILPQLEGVVLNSGGTLAIGYFPEPSPGTVNGVRVDGFVKDTHFSVDRGFFSAPFSVTITEATPGTQIRYTTNGTVPTATTGTVYSGPFTISTTTVLRAAAFRSGWQPSNVDTQTYIFAAAVKNQAATQAGFPTTWGHVYDFNTGGLGSATVLADYQMDSAITASATYSSVIVPALETTLPVLSLVGNTQDIFGTYGIYTDGRLTDGLEIPISAEFFGPGSGTGFRVTCGLRIHGGDALVEHPKKPFRLYFRKDYGVDKLDFPMFADSSVRKFDRLQLRGGGHDSWSVPFGSTSNDLAYHASYIRDQFLRKTEVDQGRLSPHGRFVHLYINGLYWGFYNLHEVPGDDYFKSHLGGADAEDWDVVEQPYFGAFKVVDGNGDAMDALLALCTPSSAPANPATYAQIANYLDVDNFIDHMIVQIWAGQNDWMGPVFRGNFSYSRFFNKNWDAGRLSRGATQTGFFFNVWDAEISMGSQLVYSNVGGRIVDFDHSRVGEPGGGGTPGPPAQIYFALRSNADFRARFGDRLQKHFFNNGAMTPAANQARLAAMRATLLAPIVAESARWGDVNGPDFTRDGHWLPEMDWLRDTFTVQRNAIVLGQFRSLGLYPTIDAPAFNQFGGLAAPAFQLVITNPNAAGGTVYYTTDGTDPNNGGAPSGTAVAYSVPFALSQTGPVKARILSGGTWSALTEATFIVGEPATAANLVLSEFNYQPAEPTLAEGNAGYTGADFEYIELYNPTAATLELTGLEFIAGIAFDFADSSIQTLDPGARMLIVRNVAAFQSRHGPGLPIIGTFASGTSLSNGGERLAMIDNFGNAIFDFTYNNKSPWPNPPAGSGLSLVLIQPDILPSPALPGNWRLSRLPGGSPGADDRPYYVAWLTANGGSGSELNDQDADGLVNLLEYALASNPVQFSAAALPTVAVQPLTVGGVVGDYLTITFRRQFGAEDIAFHVEFSDAFETWDETGVLVATTHNVDGSTTETWRSGAPIAGAVSQFARVRVVK